MHDLSAQLEMFGLDGARRLAEGATTSARERSRLLRRIDVTHELMSELPAGEDLSFLHSGLCQTCLPHSRPGEDHAVWQRKSGRFSLTVQPGVFDPGDGARYVGVPYGPKARLILIHLQTEGMRSRTVNLGASFSAFMRSLGLAVTGGKRGTIGAVREQSLRISQCSFTMQWSTDTSAGHQTVIANTRIVAGWSCGVPTGRAGRRRLNSPSDSTRICGSTQCRSTDAASPICPPTASASISMRCLPIGCRGLSAMCTCDGQHCSYRSEPPRRRRSRWHSASGRSCQTS